MINKVPGIKIKIKKCIWEDIPGFVLVDIQRLGK